MLLTYGRGRAEQFRLHPTPGSALNFVPPLFCLYLALGGLAAVVPSIAPYYFLPLALYALAVLGQTAALLKSGSLIHCLAAMPLIILTHFLYGLGFWRGFFTTLEPPAQSARPPVDLEILTR